MPATRRVFSCGPSVLTGLLALLLAGAPLHAATEDCHPLDGLEVLATADARDTGYRLSTTGGHTGYFRQALYDLILGRIRFFEVGQPDGRHRRYQLASHHDARCLAPAALDNQMDDLPMPARQCVARSVVDAPGSRYAVEGYPDSRDQGPAEVTIRDLQTGSLLATYRRPASLWLSGKSTCQEQAMAQPGHPVWGLTGLVFKDRRDGLFTSTDLSQFWSEAQRNGNTAALMPPRWWARRQLAEAGVPVQAECGLPGWMGDTEIHVIEPSGATVAVPARLDANSESADFVILDVHVPDKSLVLLLRATRPTIWHVHESSRSAVVALLVSGDHGQAVEGLTRHSRILMSTRQYNPFTNCTARELGDIEGRITRQYGVTRTLRQASNEPLPVATYVIGDEMPDGAELFSIDYPREAFELRDE